MSAKKRSAASTEDAGFNAALMDDKKRRRKEGKKQSTFKPLPVANSSDTPPEEEYSVDLPPPPSEKRIARRRESTRAIRERVASESPTREAKSAKRSKVDHPSSSTDDALAMASSSRPRPSAPRPSSPPPHVHSRLLSRPSGSGAAGSMGPPSGFVRRTRKSMRGTEIPSLEGDSMDSLVPLPESETPMIRKNKELREAQSRRSSLGQRGQRASSSLGRGEISIPHSSVDTKLFYTHLGNDMPEPIRARHLIAWCAKRAADAETGKKSKSKGKERTSEGDRLINEIMEEVIMSLGKGNVDTNVFANVPSSSVNLLKPHPKNAANRETQAKEEAIINRCRAETSQWTNILNSTARRREAVHKQAVAKRSTYDDPDLSDAGWMMDALKLADGVLAEGEGDLTKMGEFEDVEFKVDSLLHSTHVAVQYSRQSQRFLDGIFSSLTADLRAREAIGLPSSIPGGDHDGPDTVAILSSTTRASALASSRSNASAGPSSRQDPMSILRALASADAKVHNEEAVAAAALVTPVIPSNSAGMNVSVATGVGATPRRVGQATPRRAQGTYGQSSQPTPRSVSKRAETAELAMEHLA